eukprot:TRINITY_DN17427_c0_g1_i1.p1 TRINITY_DN17427_c0_g1~~TRINITY_DN17427_c0_g1_i1.p1  ORF type:complete len:259 (-),score=44.98 TRINITY_DN17427_c0_g1_i1:356-1033(-)
MSNTSFDSTAPLSHGRRRSAVFGDEVILDDISIIKPPSPGSSQASSLAPEKKTSLKRIRFEEDSNCADRVQFSNTVNDENSGPNIQASRIAQVPPLKPSRSSVCNSSKSSQPSSARSEVVLREISTLANQLHQARGQKQVPDSNNEGKNGHPISLPTRKSTRVHGSLKASTPRVKTPGKDTKAQNVAPLAPFFSTQQQQPTPRTTSFEKPTLSTRSRAATANAWK